MTNLINKKTILSGIDNKKTTTKAVEYFLQKADNHKEKEQWLEAAQYYQIALQQQPNNWQIYHEIGDVFINLQRWQEAINAYRSAIKINPQFSWSYYNLGESLLQVQDCEAAFAAYEKARELEPNLPGIERKLGDTFFQRATIDSQIVREFYDQLITSEPDNHEHYHRALEITPHDVQLYWGLADALTSKGELYEAIVAYQMVLQLDPNHTEAEVKLKELLGKTGRAGDGTIPISSLEQAKQTLDSFNQITLDNFLLTGASINFPEIEHPTISIILVLYNRAELTLSCLYSILRNNFKSLEVIIIDNNSTDKTRDLLKQIKGAKIILNDENLHFLLGCNQASKLAQGDYLLFLNNDAQILGDSLNIAVKTMQSDPDIGAVGGKIILPDGTLQEAGSIIWQDGGCLGYGRGDSPTAPQYMFRRSVDFCSGAFLLTPRQLFLEMGSFDQDYQPAYYEETDYCVRLLRSGKKVIYEPNVVILHYEFGSSSNSSSSDHAIALQRRNHQTFIDKHRDWLTHQYPPDINNTLFARTPRNEGQRILFIEDRIPHSYFGSGFPRSNCILSDLVALGYSVTLYPTDISYQEEWINTYSDISVEVEVMTGYGIPRLEEFLSKRQNYYHIVFVTRPHNMKNLNRVLAKTNYLEGAKIIYDAEALYCLRDFEQKRLQGEKLSSEYIKKSIDEELQLAKKSDYIISVSPQEKEQFTEYGYQKVGILGHSLASQPTPNHFDERQDILFVGAIHEQYTPNADSVMWLSEKIYPILKSKFEQEIKLLIAGTNNSQEIKERVKNLDNNSIKMLGRVENLTNLYNQARLFIAPTRFGAGISLKVLEAAAHGLPIISTSLIATQLGWKHEHDLLVADTAEDFAKQCIRAYQDIELWQHLRNNVLKRIEQEYSPHYFQSTLKQILED